MQRGKLFSADPCLPPLLLINSTCVSDRNPGRLVIEAFREVQVAELSVSPTVRPGVVKGSEGRPISVLYESDISGD